MKVVSVFVRDAPPTKLWNAHWNILKTVSKVVEMDLEKFFDRVNHDKLMSILCERVTDKPLLKLIRRYLQAGIMEGGWVSLRTEGTP